MPAPSGTPSPWRPALIGFAFVLMSALWFLKPHLPKALFYNFANHDDYPIFANRLVKAEQAQPWKKLSHAAPPWSIPAEVENLLVQSRTTALVVIKNGELVLEKYWLDGGEQVISGSFSMAKSIVGLLAVFAKQDGHIASFDHELSMYLPELKTRPEGKITLKQLLSMRSGLNWDEHYASLLSMTTEAYYGNNLYRTALKQRLVAPSGVKFSYQSGDTQLLGMAISRAVKKTLAAYATEKLWMPLGAETDALWSLDHEEGLEKAFCCFNATARDFARIGQLVLQKGTWGQKQLISQDLVNEMLTPIAPDDPYGYQWWIYHDKHKTNSHVVYYAQGILGQFIIVSPSTQTVIVRLGQKRGKKIGTTYEEGLALMEWAQQI